MTKEKPHLLKTSTFIPTIFRNSVDGAKWQQKVTESDRQSQASQLLFYGHWRATLAEQSPTRHSKSMPPRSTLPSRKLRAAFSNHHSPHHHLLRTPRGIGLGAGWVKQPPLQILRLGVSADGPNQNSQTHVRHTKSVSSS